MTKQQKASPKQLKALATVARVNQIPAAQVDALSQECYGCPLAQLSRADASQMFFVLMGVAAGEQAA